jgi:hypothetical protein
MQYKAILTLSALTANMAVASYVGGLQKRDCQSTDKQYCCAIEENPNYEILPGLYIFAYGIGCSE